MSIQLDDRIAKELSGKYAQRDALLSPFATKDGMAIRKDAYTPKIFRRQFIRDCEVILNLPLFNRYAGKTQVFSLRDNDDISTRSYHVALVSRIGRTIGQALSLNCDLIEAIALAHDLGHCPFGHRGEKLLDNVAKRYGYRFFHHVQGARYLLDIVKSDLSLQVIDGVLCHNGEEILRSYAPNAKSSKNFKDLNEKLQLAYVGKLKDSNLMATTLEGCLVRICDVIAYVGKDRQDAEKLRYVKFDDFSNTILGKFNHEIIAALSADIINNSFDKNQITMSGEAFDALMKIKDENYGMIYLNDNSKVDNYTDAQLQDIIDDVFELLLEDIQGNQKIIDKSFRPYIYPNSKKVDEYFEENKQFPHRVAIDMIAGMSDKYLLNFHGKHFSKK
ncbi:MAG: HD domain-containing protein [Clostridia bacterium]|jgi:dGTPase|nr:HD domain-containing protein [Clostridia bacterium]MCI9291357.1 HD domain-containing protein [Clostridia bacterium]